MLLIACQNGLKKIAKMCIKAGSNIDAINLMGNTALHFSFMYIFQTTYFILKSSPALGHFAHSGTVSGILSGNY